MSQEHKNEEAKAERMQAEAAEAAEANAEQEAEAAGEAEQETNAQEQSPEDAKKNAKKDPKDAQIEELQDRLKRQMAEFDNFRKRTEKEKSAMYEVGARDIIEKILPVVDNFERALLPCRRSEGKLLCRRRGKDLQAVYEDTGGCRCGSN